MISTFQERYNMLTREEKVLYAKMKQWEAVNGLIIVPAYLKERADAILSKMEPGEDGPE